MDHIDINSLTPMMQQYVSIKQDYKDCILFYRMGDFYELFFDDAIISAKLLGIVLTKRGKYCVNEQEHAIPMCGVPFHSHQSYLNRLVKHGYKVAICEQIETVEESKQRAGHKAVVKREVVQVITQGTIQDLDLLDDSAYNYLCAIHIYINNYISLAWIDISSSEFYIHSLPLSELNNLLYKLNPQEILVAESFDNTLLLEELRLRLTTINKNSFHTNMAKQILLQFFPNEEYIFHFLTPHEQIVCGVLLNYILYTQKETNLIHYPQRFVDDNKLRMDLFTINSLELIKNSSGSNTGTLKSIIDKTHTAQGSRMLTNWLQSPLKDLTVINARHQAVEYLISNDEILQLIRVELKQFADLERIISKFNLKKGTPIDLILIKNILSSLLKLKKTLLRYDGLSELIINLIDSWDQFTEIIRNIEFMINEEVALNNKIKGIIHKNSDSVLDAFRTQELLLEDQLLELQNTWSFKLNIPNLKISQNNLIGLYIEVNKKYASEIIKHKEFIHKGTLANAVRYTTDKLNDIYKDLLAIDAKIISKEKDILLQLSHQITANKVALYVLSGSIAQIDLLTNFAFISLEYGLIKPQMLIDSAVFEVVNGRHLVIEDSLQKHKQEKFVSNDCMMGNNTSMYLITGPNMSGKSTFLRQNALIIILAHIGCFVPASSASIGVCDAIYSRVGSSDDLYKGQSTFMVEMLELASILHHATQQSFIILDEIGRGTATYDGIAIAWASIEYISKQLQARTLFATHYHELVVLEQLLDNLKCYFVQVEKSHDHIIFMHNIQQGVSNQSYGIDVANISGLPKTIINRAIELLSQLEDKSLLPADKHAKDLPLLEHLQQQTHTTVNHYPILVKDSHQDQFVELFNFLSNNLADLDTMTPLQALNLLYQIKTIWNQSHNA